MLHCIRELSLIDFRLFQNAQTLSFETGSPDLHLVVGSGGTGKTILCDALRFLFIGEQNTRRTSDVSWPVIQDTEAPVSATVRAELEAAGTRYRITRTVTEQGTIEERDQTVDDAHITQYQDGKWNDIENQRQLLETICPQGALPLMIVHDEELSEFQAKGWEAVTKQLLTASAAVQATNSTPSDSGALWEDFCSAFEGYVAETNLSQRFEVAPEETPFTIKIGHSGIDAQSSSTPPLPAGEATQLALAIVLAAGDCADIPQWFDMPLARLDDIAAPNVVTCFETAAMERQIGLFSHPTSVTRLSGIETATAYHLELQDSSQTVVSEWDQDAEQ
jgi:hypothetical protein